MFNKGEELLELCLENNKSISHIVIKKEMEDTEISYENLMNEMQLVLDTMIEASNSALDQEIISISKLTGGDAQKMESYKNNEKTVSGNTITSAMAKALSTSEVNASMGRIVAAPTAGASGIVPSALISTKERFDLSDSDVISGLFTAAAIGEIIAKNATISGAEGGCQAECGVAASMAAAAIVEMVGGDVKQALNAASFALINVLGLVCDPIAGLVEFPCALRNASGVSNALISADIALSGIESLVPFDEVVEAMYKIGKSMPEALRETALGGLAATPTGKDIERRLL